MPLSNASAAALMNLLFENQAFANIGDAPGLQPSATAGNYYIALHSADPGAAGTQSTSEITYGGYARVAVPRVTGFNTTANTAANALATQFATATSGTATATHFTVGLQTSGAGVVLLRGALNITLNIQTGTTPVFQAGELVATANIT